MPPGENEEGAEGTGETGESEEKPDELITLKAEMSTLKEMLKALMPEESGSDDVQGTEGDKDKPKPHADTIKYAESLKKSMGKLYVADWDKITISKRIEKMESFIEFKTLMDKNKAGKVKEGKLPKGKSDDKKSVMKSYGGINHKKRALAFKENF